METQNLMTNLYTLIRSKDNIMHKKAQTIIDSITLQIKNNPKLVNILQNDRNSSLFLVGACYKLLEKSVNENSNQNCQPLLFLINYLLPKANPSVIISNNLSTLLQNNVLKILQNSSQSLIAAKYSISVLAQIVLLYQNITTKDSVWEIIATFIQIGIQHTGDLQRKEVTKNLELILEKHYELHKQVGYLTKKIVLQDLQIRKEIHLNCLKQIVKYFPIEIVNDICFSLKNNLRNEEEYSEMFLIQIYFFLDKVIEKKLITSNVSEEILKQLINNIPSSIENQRLIFGYLQATYESILHLNDSNRNSAQKYISSCISIFSQMLLLKGRIATQSANLLKELLENIIDESLWKKPQNDFLDLEGLQLEDNSHAFVKSICMIKDLITNRYEDQKHACLGIIGSFFANLNESSFQYVKALIIEFQNVREQFSEGEYNEVFGKIINKIGYKHILDLFPITLQGDPTSESFDESNNLWLLKIMSKYAKQDSIEIFVEYFLPLIKLTEIKALSEKIALRRSIYTTILTRLWQTLEKLHLINKKNQNFEFLLAEIQKNLVEDYPHFQAVVRGLQKFANGLPFRVKYVSERAQKIIPVLAKILKLQKPITNNLLSAIAALSKICNKEYLNRVFEKNSLKLISEHQTEKFNENQQNNLKNLEILMAISFGINFFDSAVLSNKLSKQQTVLKLLQCLIGSDNIFQKKAYKYLLQSLNYMSEQFSKEALIILDKFDKTLPFSKGYRISILEWVWTRSKYSTQEANLQEVLQFIKKYLPQIIIALRQSNKRVRRSSRALFNFILQKMQKLNLLESFIEIICAGLASNTTSVKADTINALVITLQKSQIKPSEQFLQELNDVILILLREKKKEIYKAVLIYTRKYILGLDKLKQITVLPLILKELFDTDQDSKMEYRSLLKHFLLKLIKRHTQQKVLKMVPQNHQRFIKSIVKAQNTLKRKNRKKKLQYKLQNKLNKKKKVKNDESSDDQASSEQQSESVEQQENRNSNRMDQEQNPQQMKLSNKNNLLAKYDLDKQDFHFIEQKRKKIEKKQQKKEQENEVDFVDGKIVFKQLKRKREQNTGEGDLDEDQKQMQLKKIPRKIKKVKIDTIHQIKQSGEAYHSQRANGDIKLKNKPQPHAFIQLNSKALNKRYKHKAEKVFESIFQKKEGGLKGLKSKVLSKFT